MLEEPGSESESEGIIGNSRGMIDSGKAIGEGVRESGIKIEEGLSPSKCWVRRDTRDGAGTGVSVGDSARGEKEPGIECRIGLGNTK